MSGRSMLVRLWPSAAHRGPTRLAACLASPLAATRGPRPFLGRPAGTVSRGGPCKRPPFALAFASWRLTIDRRLPVQTRAVARFLSGTTTATSEGVCPLESWASRVPAMRQGRPDALERAWTWPPSARAEDGSCNRRSHPPRAPNVTGTACRTWPRTRGGRVHGWEEPGSTLGNSWALWIPPQRTAPSVPCVCGTAVRM
jgi:hypothetical protein